MRRDGGAPFRSPVLTSNVNNAEDDCQDKGDGGKLLACGSVSHTCRHFDGRMGERAERREKEAKWVNGCACVAH